MSTYFQRQLSLSTCACFIKEVKPTTTATGKRTWSLPIVYFIIVGLLGGAILSSTGTIGPFWVPALMILGIPSGVARGTCIVSELLMTLVSVIGHRKVSNIDKRVTLAFLPGALVVALGTSVSVEIPELLMKLSIGMFEMAIGVMMIYAAVRWVNRRSSKTVNTKSTMAKLVLVAVLAGFAKGFFGAGWGPIGVGLFILLGIDPRIAVGSSLVIRLLLDGVGGMTYATMNLVDINTVIALTLAGCVTVPLGVKLITAVSEKNLSVLLGGMAIFLGAFVFIQTLI
jgi:uncharacterized membrane protein YfcA